MLFANNVFHLVQQHQTSQHLFLGLQSWFFGLVCEFGFVCIRTFYGRGIHFCELQVWGSFSFFFFFLSDIVVSHF